MTTPDLTIQDLNKEHFFALINQKNQGTVVLKPNDFDLEVLPTGQTDHPEKTTITFKPKEGTPYYGNASVTYSRIQLQDIFNNVAGTETIVKPTIYEILGYLSTLIGVTLSEDDLEDGPIPPYLAYVGNNPRIIHLKAKPGSLMLYGECDWNITPLPSPAVKLPVFYIHLNPEPTEPFGKQKMVKTFKAVDDYGADRTEFSFLANVLETDFNAFEIVHVFPRPDNCFILRGSFNFKMTNGLGEVVTVDSSSEAIVVDANGIVVEALNYIPFYSDVSKMCEFGNGGSYRYAVDDGLATGTRQIIRYNYKGVFEASLPVSEAATPVRILPVAFTTNQPDGYFLAYFNGYLAIYFEAGFGFTIQRFTKDFEPDPSMVPIFIHGDNFAKEDLLDIDLSPEAGVCVLVSMRNIANPFTDLTVCDVPPFVLDTMVHQEYGCLGLFNFDMSGEYLPDHTPQSKGYSKEMLEKIKTLVVNDDGVVSLLGAGFKVEGEPSIAFVNSDYNELRVRNIRPIRGGRTLTSTYSIKVRNGFLAHASYLDGSPHVGYSKTKWGIFYLRDDGLTYTVEPILTDIGSNTFTRGMFVLEL